MKKTFPFQRHSARKQPWLALLGISGALCCTANGQIVISEVYGGGGNSGAVYTNDFIELYNPTAAVVDVSTWAVQYASSTGTTWQVAPLAGSIPAGGYYFIQLAGGTNGVPLPTPNTTGSFNMAGSNGKVALTNDQTALTGTGLGSANVVDFVGYGSAATYEGTGAAPALSSTTSASRDASNTDTDDNSADFTAGAPTPTSTPSADVPPTLDSVYPADDSTTAIAAANLILTFSENVTANSGSITIYNAADDTVFESFDVTTVSISGATVTLNPNSDFANGASYYVQIDNGALQDSASQAYAGIADMTTWNFTTEATPVVPATGDIVISQYYEGTASTDRYIELHNLTGADITMDGYSLAVWSNTAPSSNENWKVEPNTTNRVTVLDGYVIPANGYFLVAEANPGLPTYAASNHNLQTGTNLSATDFDGDDSVVLYNGTGFTRAEVVDAISIVGTEGTDISYYRLDNQPGYNFLPGSSITDFSTTWGTKTPAEVDAATSTDAFYLAASQPLGELTISISPDTFLESAGTGAATATITRNGDTTDDLFVDIYVSDTSEADTDLYTVIPAGDSSVDIMIDAIDDAFLDGDQTVTFTVVAGGYANGIATATVQDDATDAPLSVVINEVDSDNVGTDADEFIELYNSSGSAVSLDGFVLVLYNGGDTNNASYNAIDLSGHTIPANDFFVIGSATVPNVDMVVFTSSVTLQNGADAVALYLGNVGDYPNGTQPTAAPGTLVDAVVYGTSDADDVDLLAALTPGKPQVDENLNSNKDNESIARVPDGGAAFDSSLYATQMPTPGATNVIAPPAGYSSWASTNAGGQTADMDFDGDGVANGAEYFMGSAAGFTANPGLDATGTVTWPNGGNIASTAYGTEFMVQTSPDLQNWTNVGSGDANLTNDASGVSYNLAPGSMGVRHFVRLVVAPN